MVLVLYGASNTEHSFPFFGGHKERGGITLALLFLYVLIFFKIQILLLQEVTPAHAHAVMTASINAL